MIKLLYWVLWVIALILVSNFAVLMVYGDALRSTHLFIVRGTVFYPLAWLNLVFGVLLVSLLIWKTVQDKMKSK